MLRARKRSVNCLYLPISWSGPCRPVFLGSTGGENVGDGVLGPRGRGSSQVWKGSTGKWASLCRSRATRHAPRLPSSPLRWGLLSGPSKESKGDRSLEKRKARSCGTHRPGAAFLTLEIRGRRPDRAAISRLPRDSLLALIGFHFFPFLHDTLVTF